MASTKTATKQVQIIARISWKHENKVCYIVRSSTPLKEGEFEDHGLKKGDVTINGVVYGTVMHAGQRYIRYHVVFSNGRSACSCPGWDKGMHCYHRDQLAVIESARPAFTPISTPETVAMEVPETAEIIDLDEKAEAEMAWASIRRNLHRAETERIAREIEASKTVQAVSESIYEKMLNAALNGPRAFSLLR